MIILYRGRQRSGNVFMKKIYRGYPPEGKRGNGSFASEDICPWAGTKKVPWMLYRREEQGGKPAMTGNEFRGEIDYLRELYPISAKKSRILAEEACDLLEYPGSPMYDEYPDREFLYRELSKVRERHPEEIAKDREEQDLLQVLFVNEIYRRRILKRMENLDHNKWE